RAPRRSSLFPYTTLFRSAALGRAGGPEALREQGRSVAAAVDSVLAIHADLLRQAVPDERVELLVDQTDHAVGDLVTAPAPPGFGDRKSTRLNSSHDQISY